MAPPDGEHLGSDYERQLGRETRRARGCHYTPRRLAEPLVRRTLEPLLGAHSRVPSPELRICDPACGAGALLLQACRFLAEQSGACPLLPLNELALRRQIATQCLMGVDRDPKAVELTRQALGGWTQLPSEAFEETVRCGDSLALDWPRTFPDVFRRGGFDAVLVNPPWGQKLIAITRQERVDLQRRFPSSRGQFDWFRPFTEAAVRLVRPGGTIGLVLPDIVLLKNYPETRRFLLEQLRVRYLSWHAEPFRDAVIDVVLLMGERNRFQPNDCIVIERESPLGTIVDEVRHDQFARPPGYEFNLHLTARRRDLLDALTQFPTLGDYFEVHEGVHSGNIRSELFVTEAIDESCRPLFLGREEIRPHRLQWGGPLPSIGGAAGGAKPQSVCESRTTAMAYRTKSPGPKNRRSRFWPPSTNWAASRVTLFPDPTAPTLFARSLRFGGVAQ